MRGLRKIIKWVMILFTYSHFAIAAEVKTPHVPPSGFGARPDVQLFINEMVKKHHFKADELNIVMSAVKPREQVIRHINKPLEKEPWHLYQMLFVNEWRIQHGVEFWKKTRGCACSR